MTTKITPCLWFDSQAEEAAKFYTAIFPNSKILRTARNSESAPGPTGAVLTVEFSLDGNRVLGLNGGPHFKFSEAISFSVECETQKEIDRYWDALIAGGGAPSQCGWLKDRFGLSWQVVPSIIPEMLKDCNSAKANRVMKEIFQMRKIDIATLQKAYAA